MATDKTHETVEMVINKKTLLTNFCRSFRKERIPNKRIEIAAMIKKTNVMGNVMG